MKHVKSQRLKVNSSKPCERKVKLDDTLKACERVIEAARLFYEQMMPEMDELVDDCISACEKVIDASRIFCESTMAEMDELSATQKNRGAKCRTAKRKVTMGKQAKQGNGGGQ